MSTVPSSRIIIQSLASPSAINSCPGCALMRSMLAPRRSASTGVKSRSKAEASINSGQERDSRSHGPSDSRPRARS